MRMTADVLKRWSIGDSAELYSTRNWGLGYFGVNNGGHLVVNPAGDGKGSIDLKELVDELVQRGISAPLLIRFNDLLRSRVENLNDCFRRAIADYGYKGIYKGVYPIKVNQDRKVVEEIVEAGRKYHYGLEAGSKPELLAVMANLDDEEALIICNGYKDEEYIETALLASRLGRNVILVVEKPSELDLIKRIADKTGVKPKIGMRAKLATRGSGRWESSGGDRSKFVCDPS
jgi:arginine decarboxylase